MKAKTPPAKPAPARKLEQIAVSKKGLFAIDPTLLTLDEGFNERVNFGDITQLAEDIEANGLETPFKIRKVKGEETILIVHGHRRKEAIDLLIEQGRWHDEEGNIKPVDCYAEANGTTEFDRLAGQLSSNTGLAYNLLEKAGVYQRLLALDPSLKPADLSRRFGETKQAVSDALRLARDGCKELHKAVHKGKLAASTAITLIKQVGEDHAAQKEALNAALEHAKENGRDMAKPKDLPGAAPPPPASGGSADKTDEDPAPWSDDTNGSTDAEPPAPPEPPTPAKPAFTLYLVDGAPEEPTEENGCFYHEAERLVLTHLPTPLDRLHLLSTETMDGTAYGYRVETAGSTEERLPDLSWIETFNAIPEEGYKIALAEALRKTGLDDEATDAIEDALYRALCDYFPEQGMPKEADHLSFVAISQSQAPAGSCPDSSGRTGHAAITGAPSSNRDGSSGGSGGGYAKVEKRLEDIEAIMEAIGEDDEKDDDRYLTAEILLQVLRNERPPAELKKHLTGKDLS